MVYELKRVAARSGQVVTDFMVSELWFSRFCRQTHMYKLTGLDIHRCKYIFILKLSFTI